MVFTYDLNFYKSINNAYASKSKKETTLYEFRKDLEKSYREIIDYQPDTKVDGKTMPLVVMEYHGSRIEGNRYKKIEAPPGSTFNLGSKIDCFGLKWLVVDINYNQELKLSGQIQLCNYILKFQNKKGKIIKEECVEKTYQINSTGQDEGKIITTGNTLKHILIQCNENVLDLAQGKRLYIDMAGVADPKVYTITNINRTTNMYNGFGFFDLTCDESVFTSGDRPDLMIADYIDEQIPKQTTIGSCEIAYSGEPVLKAGGSTKTFRAEFKDGEGNVISDIIPAWELMFVDTNYKNQITILSEKENEIKLQAKSDAIIESEFVLKMTATDPSYGFFEARLLVKVGELW